MQLRKAIFCCLMVNSTFLGHRCLMVQRNELEKAEIIKPLQALNVPYMARGESMTVAALESPVKKISACCNQLLPVQGVEQQKIKMS